MKRKAKLRPRRSMSDGVRRQKCVAPTAWYTKYEMEKYPQKPNKITCFTLVTSSLFTINMGAFFSNSSTCAIHWTVVKGKYFSLHLSIHTINMELQLGISNFKLLQQFTYYVLVLSADNISKRFGSKDPNCLEILLTQVLSVNCWSRAWSGSKKSSLIWIRTVWHSCGIPVVFLFFFFFFFLNQQTTREYKITQ